MATNNWGHKHRQDEFGADSIEPISFADATWGVPLTEGEEVVFKDRLDGDKFILKSRGETVSVIVSTKNPSEELQVATDDLRSFTAYQELKNHSDVFQEHDKN